MQPEIDRRVAEERARLLERLREPSEGVLRMGIAAWDKRTYRSDEEGMSAALQAMLAAFEQENEDAD